MSALVPCPGCNRHLKSDETSCPFCHAAVAPMSCTGRCSGPSTSRVAGAALLAAGAALLGAACESSQSVVAPYGIPPHYDAGTQSQREVGAPTDGPSDGGVPKADALPDAKK